MAEPPSEVFIVGVPRSGTGILQNLVRLSPAVAWVTPATNAMTGFAAERGLPLWSSFPLAAPLDRITRALPARWRPGFLQGPADGALAGDPLVVADEGSRIWGWHAPERDHHRLLAEDVTSEARAFYREVADRHRSRFQAAVFLSKRPANALRLPFLDELFPGARFVHLTRAPGPLGASIRSNIRRVDGDWMGARPPGWREQLDRPVGRRVGWQIRQIADTLREDARERGLGERFVEVSYEQLTERPGPTLEALYDAIGLSSEPLDPLEPFLDQVENRNEGWEERLTEQELEDLFAELEGYEQAPRLPEGAVRVGESSAAGEPRR